MEDLQLFLPDSIDPTTVLPEEIDAGDTVASDLRKFSITGTTIGSGDAMGLTNETVKRDFFPFLSLPKEIRRLIFKYYLIVEDRLRARVNNELWELEAEDTYKLRKLNVVDDEEYGESCGCCSVPLQQHNAKVMTMKLTKSVETYVEGLKKLTTNSTFEIILFKINQPAYSDLLNTVSEIPAPRLNIDIQDETLRASLLTEERVEELMRGRTKLMFFTPPPSLTSEFIIRLFEGMESGTDPLREICFYAVPSPIVRSAIYTLGLHFCDEGHFHAVNPNIEVFLWTEDIFIVFDQRVVAVEAKIFMENQPGLISIQRYEDDGTKGICLFSKEEMEEYLTKIPVMYRNEGEEEEEEEGDDDDE